MADDTQKAGTSRRTFIKIGAGVVGGLVVGGAAVYLAKPSTTSTVTSISTETTTALPGTVTSTLPPSTVTSTLPPSTVTSTSTSTLPPSTVTSTVTSTPSASTVTSTTTSTSTSTTASTQPNAFQFFNTTQQPEVAALASAMIPTDSNGPGATEAGVIYFIDGQLAGGYGNNENIYSGGPYVQPGVTGPITVDGVTYSAGSPAYPTQGSGWQYPLTFQEFWRNCLSYTEDYSNSAYGANFEKLSAANQTAVLADLWNNKPTNFLGITPNDWFRELYYMVWSGFFTDPLYGGNQGMVGWSLIGFSGTNQGNAYGEGYTTKQLMVMTTPLSLKPQSLTQFQMALG
jgi:gluconate 2-dehydrogenase gamma chain